MHEFLKAFLSMLAVIGTSIGVLMLESIRLT